MIDALSVELSGEANAADILRQVPQIGVSGLSPTNSNFFTTSQGMNTIDLRNLGTDRTLVLVNGKRFVAGSSGSQVVDINMIPTALIESIDVVTGGASAVYGSDALAGVVNFNLNKNFTGIQAALQGGWNEVYSTNSSMRASLTAGSDFADGKGNAVFSVSYDWSGAAYARSRPETAVDCLSGGFFVGGSALEQSCPFYSSYALGGVFRLSNAAGAASIQRVIDPTTGLIRPRVATDGFNRQGQRLNLVPLERTNFSSFVNYDVAPGHTLYFEGYYAKSESVSQIEPFPMESNNVYGMSEQVGQQQGIVAGVPLTNPFIPADLLALAISRGANSIGFQRRSAEFGNRGSESTRSTARFVIGMEGEIGGGWDYDISYVWGQTVDTQFSNGQLNVANFRNALDAIDLDSNPLTTNDIVCRDPIARAQGCIPVNIFIPVTTVGNFTQEQINYLKADSTREQRIEQEVLSAAVSGDLFELPAGAVQAVFGMEYRLETSLDRPDVLSQQGLNGGNKAPVTQGQFDVYEAFAEIEVPLVVDAAWAKELTLHGAARISDYSTVGDTFAFAADLTWAVTEDIKFRGQYAQAVRAPNIAELFQGPSETFGVVVDPCNNLDLASPGTGPQGTVRTNCLANPAIAARAALPGGFVLTQAELQGTGGFVGGNPNLSEETATTYTFGFVFTPKFAKWAEPLVLTVDYFNIEIEDAIAAVGRNTTIDLCYQSAGLGSPYCGNVVRDVNGAIVEVNTGAANSRTLETSGIDVQLGYRWDLTEAFGSDGDDLGMLTLTINYQWLNNLTTTVLPGTAFEAVSESVGLMGAFRHEAQASLLYEIGDFMINFDANYVSDAHDFDTSDYDVPAVIPSQWFFDAQVRYNVLESTTLVFGVRNLTDEFVFIGQGLAEIPTGWATDPSSYDGLGRRFYAGVRLRY